MNLDSHSIFYILETEVHICVIQLLFIVSESWIIETENTFFYNPNVFFYDDKLTVEQPALNVYLASIDIHQFDKYLEKYFICYYF